MFEGQKCRLRQTADGWEVEIAPERWQVFTSKADADLGAAAGRLLCEPRPMARLLRDTIGAIERAGIAQDADVLVVYDQLVQALRQRRPKP